MFAHRFDERANSIALGLSLLNVASLGGSNVCWPCPWDVAPARKCSVQLATRSYQVPHGVPPRFSKTSQLLVCSIQFLRRLSPRLCLSRGLPQRLASWLGAGHRTAGAQSDAICFRSCCRRRSPARLAALLATVRSTAVFAHSWGGAQRPALHMQHRILRPMCTDGATWRQVRIPAHCAVSFTILPNSVVDCPRGPHHRGKRKLQFRSCSRPRPRKRRGSFRSTKTSKSSWWSRSPLVSR